MSALERFGADSLEALARRFEGRTVAVTGPIKIETPPSRRQDERQVPKRVTITVTEPDQIRIVPRR